MMHNIFDSLADFIDIPMQMRLTNTRDVDPGNMMTLSSIPVYKCIYLCFI